MWKNIGIFVFVVLLGAVVLWVVSVVFFRGGVPLANAPAPKTGGTTPKSSPPAPSAAEAPAPKVVNYGDSGFSPNKASIKAGDTVVFKNESSRQFWPASAVHPTHSVYDDTTLSEHCGGGAAPAFDACRGIDPGGEWRFTFNKTGTWKYHDHLNPSKTGTIVVE